VPASRPVYSRRTQQRRGQTWLKPAQHHGIHDRRPAPDDRVTLKSARISHGHAKYRPKRMGSVGLLGLLLAFGCGGRAASVTEPGGASAVASAAGGGSAGSAAGATGLPDSGVGLALHLPCCNDKLLAQQDVLGHQLPVLAQQVSREATDDRARPRTKRFAHHLRRTS
jgi:hypothetical protein